MGHCCLHVLAACMLVPMCLRREREREREKKIPHNISAAWAVDREFVNILGLTGEVSNLFWHDFELLWLSGVCSGLSMDSLRRI